MDVLLLGIFRRHLTGRRFRTFIIIAGFAGLQILVVRDYKKGTILSIISSRPHGIDTL